MADQDQSAGKEDSGADPWDVAARKSAAFISAEEQGEQSDSTSDAADQLLDSTQDTKIPQQEPAQQTKAQEGSAVTIESLTNLLFQQQFQQQQMLPQMIAQAVAQALGTMAPQQQQAAPDPYAGLDQTDPDYFYKRMEVENGILRDRLDSLERGQQDRWTKLEQERHQQSEQMRLQAWQAEVVGAISKEVSSLAAGLPDDVAGNNLRRGAAQIFHSTYADGGYSNQSFAAAHQAAASFLAPFAHMRKAVGSPGPRPNAGATGMTAGPRTGPALQGQPQGWAPKSAFDAFDNPGGFSETDRLKLLRTLAKA